ncbi:MAG: SEC-C domain-containing protein [Alphaproteobacteria bacterium]|nr:SEC-C domain-containing protein [Alphaproteobacteria bacterium]
MEILARTDRPGLDPAEAFVVFGEARITLEGSDRPRYAFLSICGNPDCGCSDAQITLVDPEAGSRFAVKVDLTSRTGQIVGAVDGDAEAVVAEVVEVVDGPVADAILRRLKAFRMRKPDVAGLRIAPDFVRHDGLLPFSHVLAGGRPNPPDGYSGFYDRFELDGRTWVVQDLFCGRKGCDCREAVLDFDLAGEEGAFAARIDLSKGDATIENADGVDLDLARRVLARWRNTSPRADRKVLTARYRALRELATHPLSAEETAAPRPIGAKDPCPCGSGKRYKRCCGAR